METWGDLRMGYCYTCSMLESQKDDAEQSEPDMLGICCTASKWSVMMAARSGHLVGQGGTSWKGAGALCGIREIFIILLCDVVTVVYITHIRDMHIPIIEVMSVHIIHFHHFYAYVHT